MPSHTTHHRCPRAGVDPIAGADEALALISLVRQRPRRDETIVVALDADRCGVGIVVVANTHDPDAVIEVTEFITASAAYGGRVDGLVIASIRTRVAFEAGAGRNDVDRWLEMSDLAERAGVELVEWFVLEPGVSCPRDRLGEPPRW